MQNILVIDSSILGDASASRQLTAAIANRLGRADPQAKLTHRDVGSEPLPHISGTTLAGFGGGENLAPEVAEARALSDTLIGELQAADTVVIGAPMYNFGIPTTLKSWFDHVLRAGVTFRYTPEGPVGLMTGKRAFVVETRGGFYSEGPAASMDSQEPHLRALLGFIGITDVTFIRAERLAISADDKHASMTAAHAAVEELTAELLVAA